MGKQQTQELAKYTPAEIRDFMNDILNGKTAPVTYAECFDILDNTPDEALTELSGGDMIEWVIGKTLSFSFEGFSTTKMIRNNITKDVELANLRDKNGKLWVTGAVMAVSALKKVESLPAFVKIFCEGKEQGPNGDYFVLRVRTF